MEENVLDELPDANSENIDIEEDVVAEDNSDLIEELGNRLAQGFMDSIEVLSTIATLAERFYDGSHSRFVAEKSVMVAHELGMSEEGAFELKIAGFLHDIGKVAFFDSSLYKYPNEMTPFEYDQYMKHVRVGYHVLKKHQDLSQVAEIVLQHHERLDGSGFPNQLQGDKILPGAKIISVVDFFHNTVFKKPRTRANVSNSATKYANTTLFLEATKTKFNFALNYIYKKRGVLFEKKVVDTFIDIIQAERVSLGQKAVMRVAVNRVTPGMVFAEDYFTKFGVLMAAKGETITKEMIPSLVRLAENDQIPMKILVLK